MKLAEALAVRGDASKRFEQLRSRAQANARYQEGEPPAENAGELLAEADRVLAELEGRDHQRPHPDRAALPAHAAGITRPLTAPKLMLSPPGPGAVAAIATSSPSSRKARWLPSAKVIGSAPSRVSSSRQPS